MTAKNCTKRKRQSAAQRAARRAAEAALVAAAGARFDGDEAGAELADFIRARPALARFSVRNLALLAEQAEAREVEVTNVRTYSTWRNFYGRQVKQGAKAFKLAVPFRRDPENGEEHEATEQAPAEVEDEGKKPPRFYLAAKWFDVADTEPIEDFEPPTEAPDPVPATEDEAAAALFASLVEQAERAGYQVEEVVVNEAEAAVSVDRDVRTLTVYASRPEADDATAWAVLADLAGAVAGLGSDRRPGS